MDVSHILIIDDDGQLSDMLSELLRLEDYEVSCAASGELGLRALNSTHADLVLLDVTLPGIDGFAVLERIRAANEVPVIMLTARGEPDDRINGLSRGADDYLPKPFNPRELLLRIAAVLKRSAPESGVDQYGPFDLDRAGGIARCGGLPISLTDTEFRILDQLIQVAPAVATRDQLSRQALGRKYAPNERALDTHMSNLRQKLEATDQPVSITSVRGSGYRLRLESES